MEPTNRTESRHDVADDAAVLEDQAAADDLVDDELLVEEISIDGMCGVY